MTTNQIPENSVVEWFEADPITSGGVPKDADFVRHTGRVLFVKAAVARIQPAVGFDANSTVRIPVGSLTVIAEKAEAGWANL